MRTKLIDARNDKTIWADSYDRDLTDIFAIQSDVAKTVAAKLFATLSPEEKKSAQLLSSLGVVDALLGHNEASISEAERAVEMLPISKDALIGSGTVTNLAVVYAWNDELDQAFGILNPLAKTPYGIYFGQLKLDPYWEPLRKDPRFAHS